MSLGKTSEVVIVGAGVVGCATAYYLAKEGIKATIVERDSVAAHASGFALGGLSPLGGVGIPGPLATLSLESYRLHRGLATALPEETGVGFDFREQAAVTVAYSEAEAHAIRERLPWQQAQQGFRVEWKSDSEVLAMEPRLVPGVVGGVVTESVGLLDPYRFTLSLLHAAEKMGATMRHGNVRGLKLEGDRLRAVQINSEDLPCDSVVIAMGPWACNASSWLGINLPVEPLKGQILRLRVNGPPLPYISWGHSYAATKPDGLVWVGTTEEKAGYDAAPSAGARQSIMEAALRALPYLMDAEVVRQTACLRPVTSDELPILGHVPGKPAVIVATGAGRKGIHLGPIMGRIAADLVLRGTTSFDISPLAPGRAITSPIGAGQNDPFRY